VPLLFLVPGVASTYCVGFQKMPATEMPFIMMTVLAMTLTPLCVGMRAHVEGLAALRRAPAVILTGQAVYLGVLVTVAFLCLMLGLWGNLIGPVGIVAANLAALGVVRLILSDSIPLDRDGAPDVTLESI